LCAKVAKSAFNRETTENAETEIQGAVSLRDQGMAAEVPATLYCQRCTID